MLNLNRMARTVLFLVMVLLTHRVQGSPALSNSSLCEEYKEGSYCEHCMQPAYCDEAVGIIEYGPCAVGEACTVNFGASYCTRHTETVCACTGAGEQCDRYNHRYIQHCSASGPFLVEPCPDSDTCYNGECGLQPPECKPDSWSLFRPECTYAVYCDSNGEILASVQCRHGEYVDEDIGCSPAPPLPCDGSCFGRCPDPVDCSKFYVCDSSTVVASGHCPDGTLFDIESRNCLSSDVTCAPTVGCAFSPIPTSTPMTTAGAVTTSTTSTPDPGHICDESTLGTQYPTVACSKMYLECISTGPGIFELVLRQCTDCS